MPTAAEGLTAQSTDEAYRDAVSACIRMLVEEGREQEQASAICYSQARTATGRDYPRVEAGEGAVRPRRRGARVTGAGTEEF